MKRVVLLLALCSVTYSTTTVGSEVPAILDPLKLSIALGLHGYEDILQDPKCEKNLTVCEDTLRTIWNVYVSHLWLVRSVGTFDSSGFYLNQHSIVGFAYRLEDLATQSADFDHLSPYEKDRANRFQQSVIDANDVNSSNCLNMQLNGGGYAPRIEVYETFSTVRQFNEDCLNSKNLSFMTFEAEKVDPVTNHTFWMRKNLTAYGFYQFHVVEPMWFDADSFALYLKNTNDDTSRETFSKEITHQATQVLWNCRPNATYEFQERDASGKVLHENSDSNSFEGLLWFFVRCGCCTSVHLQARLFFREHV
jgi:hypothetical protein